MQVQLTSNASTARKQCKCGSQAMQAWLTSNASVAHKQCKCGSQAMQVRLTSIVRVLKRDLGTLKRELNELNAHSNIHNIRFFCEYSKKNHIFAI